MLIEGLVVLAFGLLTGLLSVVGAFTPPGLVGSVSGGVVVGYAFLNTFLPVTETLAGIAFLLSTFVWLFGYRLVREMWSMVPVIGGR